MEERQIQKTTDQSLTVTKWPSLQPILKAIEDTKQFPVILSNVPRTIEQALERPPISTLINAGAPRANIEAILAIEITSASNKLSVGGNIRGGQSLDIAMQLIQDYPNESLEDFCLCLRNGVKGKYGEIYRFDIMIINEWVQKYLEEKYVVLENKLMNEKDELYNQQISFLSHQDWLDKMKEANAKTEAIKKPAPLTEKEKEIEGAEKPVKQKYVPDHDYNYRSLIQGHLHKLAAEGYSHLTPMERAGHTIHSVGIHYKVTCANMEDAELLFEEAEGIVNKLAKYQSHES